MNTMLTQEIEAFERMKHRLEAHHFGEWAVVHGAELGGTYPSFETLDGRGTPLQRATVPDGHEVRLGALISTGSGIFWASAFQRQSS